MNWRAAVFWIVFYAATGAVLLGVVAVGEEFALLAMIGAIFLLYLVYLWQERRKPIYPGGTEMAAALLGFSRAAAAAVTA
jgi:hypothetical protein